MLVKLAQKYQLSVLTHKATGEKLLFPSDIHAEHAKFKSVQDYHLKAKRHGDKHTLAHLGIGVAAGAAGGALLKHLNPRKALSALRFHEAAGLGAGATLIPAAISGIMAGNHAEKKWKEKNDLKTFANERIKRYAWGKTDAEGNGHFMGHPMKNNEIYHGEDKK